MIGNALPHPLRRQIEQGQQRIVPGEQRAIGGEQAHALRHGVQRSLQHHRAFGQLARPLPCILRLDVGDVGVDADDPAFAGALFVDLDPAAVGEQDHLPAIGDLMAADALGHPARRRHERAERRSHLADRTGDSSKATPGWMRSAIVGHSDR